ncbi:hypothetical protein GCK72_009137 [Caenorhabditis remanei]|uniref:Uncharacterized protein n=1 Tax=Caenorhabditis remanei TaxID=31234 RepID=A0A6A5H241_CAERE|nr:hypothetical protein GCK72_009137 [Caenorhabditis remanei]KAF1760886.1 hypothetical protein GCK72_009137 [Caenorhabditis remanei]
MQLNHQPQEIEYLGTIKEIVFEGPKRTFSGVDLKGRLNGGFKEFEGPTVKRLQFGPGSSRDFPPRVDFGIHISKETYAMSSYQSPLVEKFMAMYPNRAPVAFNRPQDLSSLRQQAPDQQCQVIPTQFPAVLGTYKKNSCTVGPIRVAHPQRQIGRRQPVIRKLRIVTTGISAMMLPTQLPSLVKPGISNSSTVGTIWNAPQLQTVPIDPKFRIVKGPLIARKTKKTPPREHQKNIRRLSTPAIMNSAPAPNQNFVQKHPLSGVVPHPHQIQSDQNSATLVMSSAPTVQQAPQHQPNDFDDFEPEEEALKLFYNQVEKEAPKKIIYTSPEYLGPVKVEISAYDELFDPSFKPEAKETQCTSAPAAEKQAIMKEPKNKKMENKKEEKKAVEEELEKGPIAALEYEDPVDQLEFENYVKSIQEEHGDDFLGMLLFDAIRGLRLDVNGQIARK